MYSPVYGKVLPPNTNRGATIEAVHLENMAQAHVFSAARKRFDMAICYCSVYDDCWIAHRQEPKVESAARCDRAGTLPFEPQL